MALLMADPARYAPDLLGFYPQERQIDRRYEMTGVNPYAMNADRYVSGLLTDPTARAEFGTGLLQGATTDLAGTPADVYAGAVDVAQAITPQNNQFNYYTNPFWMLSQSGDIAQKAQSVVGSEALGEAVYGKPEEGYGMYREPARVIGGAAGAGELALGKVSKEVAPYVAKGVNYLTDAMPRPQAVTPEGLLMDVPQQAPSQPQTLLMEGDTVPSATQTVDNVPIAEPAQVVPPTDENPVGMIAFHGSGADFDEFKLEKIGTGEGAQAYGYGLYFTDSEDIAKFYRDTVQFDQAMRGKATVKYKGKVFEDLGDTAAAEAAPPSYNAIKSIAEEMNKITGTFGKQTGLKKSPAEAAKDRVLKRLDVEIEKYSQAGQTDAEVGMIELPSGGTLEELLLADLQQQKQAVLEINADDIEIATGKIYKVGLEPKPEDLLDYDKSLKSQPKFYDALKPFYEEYGVAETADIGTLFESIKSQRGISPKDLSEKLSDAGIAGIKYRAAGSRGTGVDDAAAERNYVIFDDKLIKIMEKYGIPAGVSVTAVKGAMQDTDDGLLAKNQSQQPQGLL